MLISFIFCSFNVSTTIGSFLPSKHDINGGNKYNVYKYVQYFEHYAYGHCMLHRISLIISDVRNGNEINNIFAMITTLFLLQEIMWIILQPTAQANGVDGVIQEANPIMYVS